MQPITRRNAIKSTIAAAATGLPNTAAAQGGNNSLYSILSQYNFIGQDGKIIDKALRAQLEGNFVVVSFFYNGCGVVDSDILTRQAELAKAIAPKRLVHLVIDTHTYYDIPLSGSARRDAFSRDITQGNATYSKDTKYLNKDNVITLYPVATDWMGTPKYFDTPEKATAVIWDLENKTDPTGGFQLQDIPTADPGHYSTLAVYGPDGNPARDKSGNPLVTDSKLLDDAEQKRWADAINTQKSVSVK